MSSSSDPERLARELAALAEDCRRHAGLVRGRQGAVGPLRERVRGVLATTSTDDERRLMDLLSAAITSCKAAEGALAQAHRTANATAHAMRAEAVRARTDPSRRQRK